MHDLSRIIEVVPVKQLKSLKINLKAICKEPWLVEKVNEVIATGKLRELEVPYGLKNLPKFVNFRPL